MWNVFKKGTNELMYKTNSDICWKKLMLINGKRRKDKLGEITTKNLLCNTGNSTQNSVMIYMGKKCKKE